VDPERKFPTRELPKPPVASPPPAKPEQSASPSGIPIPKKGLPKIPSNIKSVPGEGDAAIPKAQTPAPSSGGAAGTPPKQTTTTPLLGDCGGATETPGGEKKPEDVKSEEPKPQRKHAQTFTVEPEGKDLVYEVEILALDQPREAENDGTEEKEEDKEKDGDKKDREGERNRFDKMKDKLLSVKKPKTTWFHEEGTGKKEKDKEEKEAKKKKRGIFGNKKPSNDDITITRTDLPKDTDPRQRAYTVGYVPAPEDNPS